MDVTVEMVKNLTDDELVALFLKDQSEVAGDEERAHITGDIFLTTVLKAKGFPKLAKLFDEISNNWWYA